MTQIVLFISLVIFISGCTELNDNQDKEESQFENFYGADTLTITARFGDCGEWGGHIENMYITRTDRGKITLRFQRDTVNCPDPARFNRRIIEDWTIELSSVDQVNILEFIKSLTEMTFKDEGLSNAGDFYSVQRSTGGLSLEYSNYDRNWAGFKELKKKLTTANMRLYKRLPQATLVPVPTPVEA